MRRRTTFHAEASNHPGMQFRYYTSPVTHMCVHKMPGKLMFFNQFPFRLAQTSFSQGKTKRWITQCEHYFVHGEFF